MAPPNFSCRFLARLLLTILVTLVLLRGNPVSARRRRCVYRFLEGAISPPVKGAVSPPVKGPFSKPFNGAVFEGAVNQPVLGAVSPPVKGAASPSLEGSGTANGNPVRCPGMYRP